MLSKYKPSPKYGVSDKKVFKVYEKVFARMRTFAPWPAKILPQQFPGNGANNGLKNCMVYFYGTNDIGECTFVNIYDYGLNKDQFKELYNMSSKRDPRIEEAFLQAELDDGSQDKPNEPYADGILEFEAPLKELWEREQKKIEKGKRKKDDYESMDEGEKGNKRKGRETEDELNSTENDNTTDDEDDGDDDYGARGRSRKRGKDHKRRKGRPGSRKKSSRTRSDSECGPDDLYSDISAGALDLSRIMLRTQDPCKLVTDYLLRDMDIHETNPRLIAKLEEGVCALSFRSSMITVFMPDGNIVELPVRPQNTAGRSTPVTPAELNSFMAKREHYESAKLRLLQGDTAPSDLSALVSPQLNPDHQAKVRAKRNKMEKFLAVEHELIEEMYRLKGVLTMLHMDFRGVFNALDKIMQLSVRPLMLKKHPCLVESIKCLQNYDVSEVKLRLPSARQQEALETQAQRVRCKADGIMEMFSSLFVYPVDKMNFYRAFALELAAFNKETWGVPEEDILALID